ncbi:MAG TPA: hypothetical protein VGK30_10335 [Candidatus Binatia bacterium]|jgi:hypothetical protein
MRIRAFIAVAIMLAGVTVGAAACEEHKGPAQKAGEKLDKATDKVSDSLDPKGPVEKAGRKIDRATGD